MRPPSEPDRRRQASAPPRLVAGRELEHDYSVDHQDERLIILTNSDGTEDYRVVEAPVASPGRENWREIEPHRSGRLILDVVAFKDFLVRLKREDGLAAYRGAALR
jgi:oligopeptidase B